MPSNGQLRTYQILVFIATGTAGLVMSISIGWTSRILSGECILHSNMYVIKQPNGTLLFVDEITEYGNTMECSFSTFCPVGVTIYCIIWIWFYIFLSDWGTSFIDDKHISEDKERPPPDQHLLVPSIACNVLVLGLLLATVAVVEAGRSQWCVNLETLLQDISCSYVGTVAWLNLSDGQDLYGYLNHARISCWVLLFSMLLQSIIIFIRLRRNSRRPRLDSTLSFDQYSEAYTEVPSDEPKSEPISSEPVSEPTSEPFSDSELSIKDRSAPTRRRLKRQKKVIIDLGEHDDTDVRVTPSTALLQSESAGGDVIT